MGVAGHGDLEPGHGERNARGWRGAGGRVQDAQGRGAAGRRVRHGLTTDDAGDGAPRGDPCVTQPALSGRRGVTARDAGGGRGLIPHGRRGKTRLTSCWGQVLDARGSDRRLRGAGARVSQGAGRGKARARGVPQRGWGSDTPYCTRSDYSVPVGVGPGGGAWAGVCRALGCVNSVRPMCPVFRAMCQLWRGMCPLLRGICPVFRAMCSLSRPMCSVFRAMCSPFPVFPVMCSVFGVMCSVSADARPGGLVACGGRGFLAGFERTGRLSDECEAARDAWWLGPTGGSGPIHHERGAGRLLSLARHLIPSVE